MPNLSDFESHNVIKMLLIGDSGNGKTGSIASLALAGYQVRIIDFDKGIEVIKDAILKAGKPEALKNVNYIQLDDVYQIVGGRVIPKGIPTAFSNCLKLLDKWSPTSVPGADELGSPAAWGKDSVLVIDSLSHLCNATMRYVQATNPSGVTSGKNPSQPEWGSAQQAVEGMLALIYSSAFKTNVIITAHVNYIQGKESLDEEGKAAGMIRGLPNALGQALPPKIPSYFNHMLICEKTGMGSFTKRVIRTLPTNLISAKSPVLTGIPAELPVETGMATYFDVALGKTKGAVAVPPASVTTPAAIPQPVKP